jgi:hypothetical protein
MKTDALRLYAVLVREVDGGNEALDWLLYTNAPVLRARPTTTNEPPPAADAFDR